MPAGRRDAVDPEALASLPEFYHPVVSPNGTEVAFYYDVDGRNDLYLLDLDTGEYERVTVGEVPRNARWPLQWSGDGERVNFHLDQDGDEQNDLAAWHRDGTVETVVSVAGQAIMVDSSQDGQSILYLSDQGEQLNLYRYDREDEESQQLTSYAAPVWSGVFSPADERVAYVTNESDTLENRDVYVMAADGSDQRRIDLGVDGSETQVVDWFPDGSSLLVSDNADDLRRAGIFHLDTGECEWLGPHEAEETPEARSPSGRFVITSRMRRGATMPVVYDRESDAHREFNIPEGVGTFPPDPSGTFAGDGTVVFAHSQPDERKELYAYDLHTDEYEVLLDAAYGQVDSDTFVDATYVTYESSDGLEIGALLYDPRSGSVLPDIASSVPAVVHVHGGPHARSTKAFNLDVQVLATAGYAVLAPNYRGSTGRGREYKQAILGDWGGMEQADIAMGGRWLMDREWIDENRVGVYGGSFGGYSVYSQLTQYPDLWTTGIAIVGVTDLHRLSEEGMAHFQHAFRQSMGDPEENYDLWRERSPIEHVEAMERPICILHGANDPRVPVSQARLFREALEDLGWAEGEHFEYTEFDDEGHGSTDIDQKVRRYRRVTDYLNRRL